VTEELLRTIFDETAAGVAITDPEGRHLACNPALERMLGYSLREWKKRRIGDAVHPDDRKKVAAAREELISGKRDEIALEHRFIRKDGESVWGRSSVSVARDEGGTPLRLVAVIEDITERKQAEGNANEAREFAENLLETTDAVVVQLSSKGEIQFVNRAFEELAGYSREDLEGKNWFEILAPRNRYPEIWEEFQRLTAGEIPVRSENPILTKAGEERYILWRKRSLHRDNEIVGTVSIGIDISERRRAEEQIALLTHSLDMHSDAAYWMDSENRCFYVNDAACAAVGYTREELIGKPASFLNPQATPEALKAVWERLRTDGFFFTESVHRRKDGSEFPVEMMATYVQFGGKEYNCGFARNISERKQQERELALLTEKLAQAEKMETVGRLAGGVAHNFNNILTALIGYCELLLAKLPEGADGHQEAEQIKRAADHAASVTRELLLFSHREAGKRVRLDLNAVVMQTGPLLRQLIRSDIELTTALAPTIALVTADRDQIEQVLVNLVLNARDAIRGGGKITIATGDVKLAEEMIKGNFSLSPGHYVTLSVEDSGVGMDEDTKARVFEPFFTTKGTGLGTGLGLSTIYGIVEDSGGLILVDSKPNAGTRLTIYLPALSSRG
jgi:PAS domain S-box-containing protein